MLHFAAPGLESLELPVFEISAGQPGPRLAVMAGMHPNEVSSMEAALRLKDAFTNTLDRGSVTILPVVNMPGLASHAEFVCPVDGRNINFCFPGDPHGSFSEVLAHALLHEWAANADVLVDLHGGDLREDVAKFVMCQMTGIADFDDRTRTFAHGFDADVVVEFAAGQTSNRGRAANERPGLGRHAVMSEAGRNGLLEEDCVAFHTQGVLNIARHLGLIGGPLQRGNRARRVLGNFLKVAAPAAGRFYREVAVGDQVEKGQRLARLRNLFGVPLAEIRAPLSGRIIMMVTHNIVAEDEWVISLGEVIRE
ncbi:succinylglutamate desuccinylase/aspartoacylase family protein [Lichenihabitans sp. Uapishka_5]|uniref:succinylglutamate desuccinylase/aspartoacylase family protein n=1 Tax=Lichenihabitans sp. Uapishka_5 TaxID=3037302 RepID=UPI0029E8028E|nr:succinylglutamate desuccinylase/aspartoacylase family protein [Lichenihabitans sp. Uapishka_5]MDX7950330.1 succinylglutamate desuccinylase/aspartoacylase family protein [Lichenihabitans sp. Uapishka_5]